MTETTRIKVAHLLYCLMGCTRKGSQIAAALFNLRPHWVRDARACGRSYF